jgi:hypothetical protein
LYLVDVDLSKETELQSGAIINITQQDIFSWAAHLYHNNPKLLLMDRESVDKVVRTFYSEGKNDQCFCCKNYNPACNLEVCFPCPKCGTGIRYCFKHFEHNATNWHKNSNKFTR